MDINKIINEIEILSKTNIESKKKYGEVFTPFPLINDMLNALPVEVWTNPNLKWLDPAVGIGNFPAVVIKRLMEGLKTFEPDAEKRYKYIIENMIYVCDIQPKNLFIYYQLLDRDNKYKMNVYSDSFLEEGFNNWVTGKKIEKFDVVVGNPPYQSNENERSTNGGNNKKLWPLFFKKMSDYSSNEFGIIVPTSWAAGARNPLDSTYIFNDLIKKYSVHKINLDCRKFFDVGIDISYITMNKTLSTINKCIINNIVISNLKDWEILPKTEKSISIFEKINTFEKFDFEMVRRCFEKEEMSDIKTDTFKYKTYTGRDGMKYVSERTKFDTLKKVITHRMGSLKFIIDEIGEITPNYSQIYLLKDNEIGENLITLFDTKTYTFLYQNLKYTQYNESRVLNQLPKLDLSKSWTDQELYQYFNLTQDEIDLIEKTIK